MKPDENPRFFTHVILWSIFAFILTAIIWAHFAILDEVTTGQGTVIPSSQIQIIQNLDGGIVHKILAKEGQVVQPQQILMQIDNTRAKAAYEEVNKKIIALKAAVIRLTAEIKSQPLVFPEAYIKDYPQIVQDETSLYTSKNKQLQHMQEGLINVEQELHLSEPLVAKGAVSEVEILELKRTINDIKGKIFEFQSKSLDELNKSKAELSSLQESAVGNQDKVTRTTIRSPVKGIIKQLKVNTIGGVIQPGMDIIEIVPLDDTLLIEAKIKPDDIGFIHLGQKTTVKITAYEYAIYGGLDGKVEQISADTITDEKGPSGRSETFYLVRVRTEKNHLGPKDKPLYIIPGMMATVDILTGHKSILHYLLKPILKAKENALTER